MKNVKFTQEELVAKNATELRGILKESFGVESGISRTKKGDLVKMIIDKQGVEKEEKVNKSDLLRREIRRRARANGDLNSGLLMKFMEDEHGITMSRQFVVNVRNRYLRACPELLSA